MIANGMIANGMIANGMIANGRAYWVASTHDDPYSNTIDYIDLPTA